MFGTIMAIDGKMVTLKLDETLNADYLDLLAHGGQNNVDIRLIDNRGITGKQNKVAHALIGDVATWSGDYPILVEQYLKYYFMADSGYWFSHASATRSQAREWIDFLIEFVLSNDVPLPKRYEYLTQNTSWFYYCLKYRKCCICGKHADVAHVETVGMGRNRQEIDHSDHRFMALCRKHHTEQHTIGIQLFLKLYQIIPVYLDYEERKKLHIGG